MGYRSEVVLAISKEMVPYFMVTMAQCPDIRGLVFEHADRLDQNYDDEGGWLMHWSDIKWYETYPEIATIEKFIENCDCDMLESWTAETEEEHGSVYQNFRFIRMGEEYDDVKSLGEFCCDSIYLSREVSF